MLPVEKWKKKWWGLGIIRKINYITKRTTAALFDLSGRRPHFFLIDAYEVEWRREGIPFHEPQPISWYHVGGLNLFPTMHPGDVKVGSQRLTYHRNFSGKKERERALSQAHFWCFKLPVIISPKVKYMCTLILC